MVTFGNFGNLWTRPFPFLCFWGGSGVWSTGSRYARPAYRSLALAHKAPLKATGCETATECAGLERWGAEVYAACSRCSQAPTTRQRATRTFACGVSYGRGSPATSQRALTSRGHGLQSAARLQGYRVRGWGCAAVSTARAVGLKATEVCTATGGWCWLAFWWRRSLGSAARPQTA